MKAYPYLFLGAIFVAGCDTTTGTGGTGGTGTTSSTGTKMTSTTTTTGASMMTSSGAQMTSTTGASMMTTSSSTGSGMVMCTDLPGVTDIPQTECDLLQQDCDGNLTCVPVGDANAVTGTQCASNGGLKMAGESCFDNPECEKGYYCIGVNEMTGAPGFCSRICCPDMNEEPCGPGDCDIHVTFDNADHFAMMCSYSPACMLLQPNQCDANSDCHPGKNGLAVCSFPSPNPVGPGQVCMAPNDCGDMQDCVKITNETDFTCHYVCKLGDTTNPPGLGGCPAGTTCKNISGFGFPGMGLCGM
ncbi:MAG: hypothetical protein U0414_00825 [Polyangiaceae bacterium]